MKNTDSNEYAMKKAWEDYGIPFNRACGSRSPVRLDVHQLRGEDGLYFFGLVTFEPVVNQKQLCIETRRHAVSCLYDPERGQAEIRSQGFFEAFRLAALIHLQQERPQDPGTLASMFMANTMSHSQPFRYFLDAMMAEEVDQNNACLTCQRMDIQGPENFYKLVVGIILGVMMQMSDPAKAVIRELGFLKEYEIDEEVDLEPDDTDFGADPEP